MVDIDELRSKTPAELQETLVGLAKEQFGLRMQMSIGQLTQTHLLKQVRQKEDDSPEYLEAVDSARGKSNGGFHYHGSVKCFLLMGDAMGRSMANLMAGCFPANGNRRIESSKERPWVSPRR